MRPISSILPVAAAALAAVLSGCATQKPATVWPYSSWLSKDGVPAEASFEQARDACLARNGITDPAAVAVGSEQEQDFLSCMNVNRWCTPAHGCDD